MDWTRKILLFGRTGQLGWELARRLAPLGDLTVLGSADVDFARPEEIRSAVRALQPSLIVNAAAYTAVDKAETEHGLAWAINAEAPRTIAEEAGRSGCLFVHYSTDYVFDGAKPEPYREADEASPLNVYGETKLAGERAIEGVMAGGSGGYLVLRTSWVYGPRGSNFLLNVLRLADERDELRIVADQIGAPTSTDAIAEATTAILARISGPEQDADCETANSAALSPLDSHGNDWSGIYHLTCAGKTSWFGFAEAFLSRMPRAGGVRTMSLVPISTAEFPRPARRPANSLLCCDAVRSRFGVALPEWRQAMEDVLEKMNRVR